MSKRYYVETTPSGRQRFVFRRSRSHHEHHHPHHDHDHDHDHGYAHIDKDEWKNLLERERNLRATNETLNNENIALKLSFREADAEVRRLQVWIPQLQTQIQNLADDNASLRRSIDNVGDHSEKHHRELEKMRHKLHKAEKENESLHARIRELIRQGQNSLHRRIEELLHAVEIWKRKFEAVDSQNIRLRRDIADRDAIIAEQSDRIRSYERILRRHGLC